MTYAVFGSSSEKGKTWDFLNNLLKHAPDATEIAHLSHLNISYYDYAHANQNDDFIPLIQAMLQHEIIILATPVYWYSMSAQMKTFFDRLTDLVTIEKKLGRALSGKKVFVITTYGGSSLEGFEVPFRETARYLNMVYGGCFYFYTGDDLEKRAGNDLTILQAIQSIWLYSANDIKWL